MLFSAFTYRLRPFKGYFCEPTLLILICSDAVAENSNDRKLQGIGLYSTNLAADICLPKTVAGLLLHPKRQLLSLRK